MAGFGKGDRHREETKRRISRGLRRYYQRRREAALVRPRDLDHLRASGTVAPPLWPLLEIAEQEAEELLAALGGPDRLTPQRRLIVEDLVAVGIALRAELARYMQAQDGDAAARVGTLANSRRASLAALGLERLETEIDLTTYLEKRGSHQSSQAPSEEVIQADGERSVRGSGAADHEETP